MLTSGANGQLPSPNFRFVLNAKSEINHILNIQTAYIIGLLYELL